MPNCVNVSESHYSFPLFKEFLKQLILFKFANEHKWNLNNEFALNLTSLNLDFYANSKKTLVISKFYEITESLNLKFDFASVFLPKAQFTRAPFIGTSSYEN